MAFSKNNLTILLIVASIVLQNAKDISKIRRLNCIVHNPECIGNVTCWARPMNRSLSLVNVRGNLTKPVTQSWLNIQLHKRSELTFKPYFVNVTEDYCGYFAKRSSAKYLNMLYSVYLPYTNLNHTCPYFGYVYIKDFPLDTNNIPQFWPVGEYRLDILVITNAGKVVTLQFIFETKENVRE